MKGFGWVEMKQSVGLGFGSSPWIWVLLYITDIKYNNLVRVVVEIGFHKNKIKYALLYCRLRARQNKTGCPFINNNIFCFFPFYNDVIIKTNLGRGLTSTDIERLPFVCNFVLPTLCSRYTSFGTASSFNF